MQMPLTDTKKVNIFPRKAIVSTNPPIRTPMRNVLRTIRDIRKCITSGAKVEEILPGGGKLLLNIHNYDLDNRDAKPTVSVTKRLPKPVTAPESEVNKKIEPVMTIKAPEVDPNQPATSGYMTVVSDTPKNDPEPTVTTTKAFVKTETTSEAQNDAEKPESENQPSQNGANEYAEEINTNYTRRQRRAMARAQAAQEAQASEEQVVMKDPE